MNTAQTRTRAPAVCKIARFSICRSFNAGHNKSVHTRIQCKRLDELSTSFASPSVIRCIECADSIYVFSRLFEKPLISTIFIDCRYSDSDVDRR